MNKLPKHLFVDLIPAYLADDISPETREMIEKTIEQDPELAALIDGSESTSIYDSFDNRPDTSLEFETIKKAKSAIRKKMVVVALATVAILLIPLTAMNFGDQVNWTLGDFIVMGVMLLIAGSTYVAVTSISGKWAFKVGACLTILSLFLLVWINLAVGILATENNAGNSLYLLVFLCIAFGSWRFKFDAKGLAKTLFYAATIQILIPVVALVFLSIDAGQPGALLGMFTINSVIAVLLIAAGVFFKKATNTNKQ